MERQSLLSADELFFQISLKCCADGKVAADEFALLRKLSALLGLGKEKANEIVNRAASLYKSGDLKAFVKADADFLYQDLLIKLCTDGVLDAEEDAVLQELKRILGCNTDNFKKVAAEGEHRRFKLKPLVCSNCQGLLPLEKNEWIACSYCQKKNHIPASYLDAITARASMDRQKSKIHEIRDAIGRMPTFFESVVAYFPDSFIFFIFALFVIFFQHYFNLLLFYPLAKYYQNYRLQSFHDFASPALMAFIKAAALYVIISIPFAFLYRTKRKIAVLGPLQASLAAGPPVMPGGPATCNHCGAGLLIKRDTCIISCGYCETENLVGMPENWLQKARSMLTGKARNLQDVIHSYKNETGRIRETLINLALLFVVYGGILTGFYSNERGGHFLPPATDDQQHRRNIHTDRAVKPPVPFDEWVRVDLGYAPSSRDFADLFVFMQSGETLEIIWKPDEDHYREQQKTIWFLREQPVPERMELEFYQTFNYVSSGKNEMKKLSTIETVAGHPLTMKTEISGYHNVRCHFPEHLTSLYIKISRKAE